MKPSAALLNDDGSGSILVSVLFEPSSFSEEEGLAYAIGVAAIRAWKDSLIFGEQQATTPKGAGDRPTKVADGSGERLLFGSSVDGEASEALKGGVFEGQKIVLSKDVDGERRIKLADGTLIAFDLATGLEKRRKVPGAGVGAAGEPDAGVPVDSTPATAAPTPPEPNYLFAAVESLTDLVGECYEECKGDHAKAMELLESLKTVHPVLKVAAPSWKDRATRRMLVLDVKRSFPEEK